MRLDNILGIVSQIQAGEGESQGRWIEGRMVRVLAGGVDAPTKYTAAGLSYVPAGVRTSVHTHESEELAFVVCGSGVVDIDGTEYPVVAGDFLLVESNVPHQTWADDDSDLGVFWTYAPPDSVARWSNPLRVGG